MRAFVATLEEWIIRTLASFNVRGERREDRIGVWVRRPDKGAGREDKIAAIGIRLKRWVSLHGIALNVDCDLSHFSGIVPCGVAEPRYGVTSLADLGVPVSMAEVDMAMRTQFEDLFGDVAAVAPSNRRQNGEPLAPAAQRRSSGPPSRRSSASTRAPKGPLRQASTIAATVSAGPAKTASTVPSRRLRTQPSRPRRERLVLGPGAIAHALHAPAHVHVANGRAHPISPISVSRKPRHRAPTSARATGM